MRVAWQCLLSLVVAVAARAAPTRLSGVVTDGAGHQPIAGALVTSGASVIHTDRNGRFTIDVVGTTFAVRAQGYRRQAFSLPAPSVPNVAVSLVPFHPKALYLSFYGFGSSQLRGAALQLLETTELNALVVDVKGDRGMIPYRSVVPDAYGTGPQHIITVRDLPGLMSQLHAKGVYLIARIVTFKDDPLANAKPEWAVKDASGHIWHDREKLAWIDPTQQAAWQYDLDIAEEAAKQGFDEIQFDYVRFPDAKGLVFSKPNTEENRVAAINGFLLAARQRLAPYNVFVGADIFGYVCWNENDTFIGQEIKHATTTLDYVSPMLYPSGFTWGIPGDLNPVAASGDIVRRSLARAIARTGTPGVHFRPWLQAFKDYAFDHRRFGAEEIREQIDAAEANGADGWMLWNPHNQYTAAGLKPAPTLPAKP